MSVWQHTWTVISNFAMFSLLARMFGLNKKISMPDPPRPPADPSDGTISASDLKPQVFISHSSHDSAFGFRLLKALQDADVDTWYDKDGRPENEFATGLAGGDIWIERINREIGDRNVFVLIVSPDALASHWVCYEHRLALVNAIPRNKVIIPVIARDTSIDSIPPHISQFQTISFPGRPFDSSFRDLLASVRLGASTHRSPVGPGQVAIPPLDIARLPLLDQFIGREVEIRQVMERLDPSAAGTTGAGLASISAIEGMPAIGKSTLAAAVLRAAYIKGWFPDGLAVVPANNERSAASLIRLALARYGVIGDDVEEASLARLADMAQTTFRGKRTLIIFDNLEVDNRWHVRDLIAPLRAAGASLLVTSRREPPANAIPANANVLLEGLRGEEAISLFTRFYGSRKEDGEPDHQAIARLVKALSSDTLGAHTLSVKLAATYARRHHRPLAELAREYEHNPHLQNLKDGEEAVETVLSSVFADSQSAASQNLLIALAGFASLDIGRQATIELARRLDDDALTVSLNDLEELYLLEPYSLAGDSTPSTWDNERVRLHPVIRSYANDLFKGSHAGLSGARQWDRQRRRLVQRYIAEWYADYIHRSSVTTADLSADEANINQAFEQAREVLGDTTLAAKIADGMRDYWRDRTTPSRAITYLEQGIDCAEIAEIAAEAAHDERGFSSARMRVLRLEYTLGHCKRLEAIALPDSESAKSKRLLYEADRLFESNQRKREALTGQTFIGLVVQARGRVALDRGDFIHARQFLQDAYRRHEAGVEKDQRKLAQDLSLLARVDAQEALTYSDEGQRREALLKAKGLFEEALTLQESAGGDAQGAANTHLHLGELLLEHLPEQRDVGCRHLQSATGLFRKLGHPKETDANDLIRRYSCS